MPIDESERSLSDGGTFAGQPKGDRDDVSLGGEATFAGSPNRRTAEMSLGDERTFGDRLDDQETVIDDIEIIDLAARYKTEGTLGRGGMGEVLLALDTRLDRKVAIKRILGDAARSKTAVSRFLTEAKAIAALNHPNVVQIYDYGRAKDGPFLIMEYVDGSSLLDRCRDGALPLEEAVDLACQLCDGLGKAHDLGIVHRDIKPANVLLTKDGLPKLTDFGLAKAEAADHQMTMTGAVLGTPDFMPPEQRRDAAEVDHRSDLWSLAATVYQMVTGRSPKIIRFDLLPPGLTSVLGKALEESKDDRYQTARELRDALKASLRGAAPAAAELGEGQCPACGVKNDSSRRFCRGCGESLETPCLSCTKPMPMWEEICGQCGTKQEPLLEERRGEMAARQAEAESVLNDHDFDKAEGIAVQLRDESDPRLKQFVPWAMDFLPKIITARNAQFAQAAARLAEAGKHEASFDYPSAIAALEHVPDILRTRSLDGQAETVATALARLSGKQAEVERLESLVKGRIAARELSGLLLEVEKLCILRPDRADVQKIRTQLEERQQKLIAQRDESLAAARSRLEAKDYEAAIAVLRKIDQTVETAELEQLRLAAHAKLRELQSLTAAIRQAVTDKRLDGLIPQVEKALVLKPGHPDLVKLHESLQAREAKAAADIKDLITQADQAFESCQFEKAVAILQRIPQGRRNASVTDRLDQIEYLAMSRSAAMAGFESLPKIADLAQAEDADLPGLVARGRSYLSQIATHGLLDTAVEQWCSRCETAAAKQFAAAEGARRAKEIFHRIVFGSAAVVAVLALVAVGLFVRSAMRRSALLAALERGEWQVALAIDTNSVPAILGLARTNLSASPPDIAGAFAELERAERIDPASPDLKKAWAAAYAARASQLATGGKLDEAGSDFEKAKSLGGDAGLLDAARDVIGCAWLIRMDAATQKGDIATLRRATTAAFEYGTPPSRLVEPWKTYARARLDAMDADGLSVACTEGMNFGFTPDQQSVLWLEFGSKAADEADQSAVRRAVDAATKLGASPDAIAALDVRGVILESLAFMGKQDNKSACDKAFDAISRNAALAAAILQRPTNAALQEAVVADYPGRFDDAAEKNEWERAIQIIIAAETIDKSAGPWLAAVADSLPAAAMASLPPATILRLPLLRNSVGVELKLLPAGRFTMGQQGGDPRETPHEVTLSLPFYIGVYEVTNRQWERVMGAEPSKWKDADRPVEQVSWEDAVEFCQRLSSLPEEQQAGRVYRLPTEAEWEYACRATFTTEYSFGDHETQLHEYAWFGENRGLGTHPVGRKLANPWGLHDMHGNVWEWCSDWIGRYPSGAVTDPKGPSGGAGRVLRGGSWLDSAGACRSAFRSSLGPSSRSSGLGFRLALSPATAGLPEAREKK